MLSPQPDLTSFHRSTSTLYMACVVIRTLLGNFQGSPFYNWPYISSLLYCLNFQVVIKISCRKQVFFLKYIYLVLSLFCNRGRHRTQCTLTGSDHSIFSSVVITSLSYSIRFSVVLGIHLSHIDSPLFDFWLVYFETSLPTLASVYCVGSFLAPLHRLFRLNSGHLACLQMPLHSELC